MATTLEAIQEKLKRLQAQADALIAKEAQAAVDQIRKIMLAHGLTTEDIEAKSKVKREAKGIGTVIYAQVVSGTSFYVQVQAFIYMDNQASHDSPHSTVTLFAKFLGLSTSVPLAQAV